MRRSNFEKIYRKKKFEKPLIAYAEHKNYCSGLYKRKKKRFFNKLNTSFLNDNKTSWKNIKLCLSDRGRNSWKKFGYFFMVPRCLNNLILSLKT